MGETTVNKLRDVLKYRVAVFICLLGLSCLATGCGGPGPKGLAAVNSSGGLLRGVKVVSVARQAPGYRVEFDSSVDVANGYYLVTPGLTESCNTMINAEKTTGNAVFVSFASHGPGINFVDCPFSLAVF